MEPPAAPRLCPTTSRSAATSVTAPPPPPHLHCSRRQRPGSVAMEPQPENKLKEDQRTPKRRKNQEEGGSSNGGLADAISGLSNMVAQAEGCKGIYWAVMDVSEFSRDELMCALDHFMERKGAALVFLDMTESDRQLWVKRFLAKHYN